MSDPKQSRGYRNKNPGNLNHLPPGRAFEGQIGLGDSWLPEGQRRFGEYATDELGIRAVAAQLTVNQTRKGFDTVRKQITSWAPETDNNNTTAYINHVCAALGVKPDDRIDVKRYTTAKALVVGIITMECGGMPYTDATIDAGLALYGLTPHSQPAPVATVAQAAKTGNGRGIIAGTVGTGAVALAVQAAPAMTALNGLDWRVGVALVVAGSIGVAVWLLTQRKEV